MAPRPGRHSGGLPARRAYPILIDAPYSPAPDRKKRMLRWGTGITLAGFLAGGGIALAVTGGSNPAAASLHGFGSFGVQPGRRARH